MFGYWVIMWVRYTVMRIRIDHMLAFNWKFLTPLAFAILMLTAIVHALLRESPEAVYVAGMLLANVILGLIVAEILRGYSKRQRDSIERAAKPATAGQ